jgi:hypothetical protein
VKLVGLPGHRREEGHRQPVQKLRVLALDPDAVAMAVDHLDAFQAMLAKVDPRLVLLRLEALAVIAEADDVLLHQAEDRRMQARMGQALDAIDVVLGGQLPTVAPAEVGEDVDAGELRGAQGVVGDGRHCATGKGRMRLVTDARLDGDDIIRERDPCRIGVIRQRPSLRIQVARLRHRFGGGRDQLVGPLEVVVLQRRLVDLGREGDLVLAVGLHRIEMLGPLGEGAVEDVPAPVRRRIGIVPGTAAGCEQQTENAGNQAAHEVEFS